MCKILETLLQNKKYNPDPEANLNPDLNPNLLALTLIITQFPFRICPMQNV